jgi:uncharacterized integral membrane protein
MGERQEFQPLTREDRTSVLLYRAGIVLSALIVIGMALRLAFAAEVTGVAADLLLYGLYASVALSVFFIHLYIGKLKIFMKNLYYLALACLGALLYIGNGSLSGAFLHRHYSLVLLLPLSGCLGFVTAKEAFCFQLIEGYILAMIMPIYLLLVAAHFLGPKGAVWGLAVIAALLVLFTLRKAFMPLAYDIGDKSAYQ